MSPAAFLCCALALAGHGYAMAQSASAASQPPTASKGEGRPEKQGGPAQDKRESDRGQPNPAPAVVVNVGTSNGANIQTGSQAHDEKKEPSHEWLIAWATVALAFITAVLAGFTALLWNSTKKLVQTTDDTARALERAYLFCGLEPTGRPTAVMSVRNAGRSFAYVTKVEWGLCEESAFPHATPVSQVIDGSLLLVTRISVHDIVEPERRPMQLWQVEVPTDENKGKIFFGRIFYEDIFKTPHYGTFKARFLMEQSSGKLEALPGCYADWS